MLELLILAVSTTANFTLALISFLKNPRAKVNHYFFLFVLSLMAWAVINYISLHPVLLPQLFWVRLALVAATILSMFLVMSINVFPSGVPYYKWLPRVVYGVGGFIAILAFTPAVFRALDYGGSGVHPVPAPGIVLFGGFTVGAFVLAITILIQKLHHSYGRIKAQVGVALFGITTTFTLIIGSNFIVVTFFSNTSLLSLAPAYTLIFVASFVYAILRHKLFDVRFLIVRLFTYTMLVLFIAISYSMVVTLVSFFVIGVRLGTSEIIGSTFVACTLILIAAPLKRYFDRLTRKIFYQDSYDSQEVIDEVSSVLVHTVAVNKITRDTLTIVNKALKVEFSAVFIPEDASSPKTRNIIIGKSEADLKELASLLKRREQSVITVDELPSQSSKLYRAMREANVVAAAKLETSGEYIGCLCFGYKAGGNIYNTQDLGLIGTVADELAVAIQNALRFEQIEQFNETLQQRVTAATSKLRQTNKKLLELDQAKDEFISMASHQMRTPLTSVKGYISMVLEGYGGPLKKEQRRLLSEAYNSSQRMVYLISDFLSISRIRTGKFIIEPKPIRLTEVIQDEINQLEVTARNRGLTLVYDAPSHFPALLLDEEKMRQVIMNLIDNAIYYTRPGGTVTVTLMATDKDVALRVQDTGIGVPKSEQHKLFSKFFRASNALKMRPDGTGIGLFLVKKIIALQGGAMIFESKEGQGSVFGFRFARHKLSADHAVDDPGREHRK